MGIPKFSSGDKGKIFIPCNRQPVNKINEGDISHRIVHFFSLLMYAERGEDGS